MTVTAKNHAPGTIDGNAAYTIVEARARMGWGVAALRKARERGLLIRRIGKRSFILGTDILSFIAREGKVVGVKTEQVAEGQQ